jgi:GTP diphosphokinase / guanosine-3',5'-bis(diphosphate) 3'-diphosphatase
MSTAFEAMMFARVAHKTQVRKYTATPYADHLAEVAGIVAALGDLREVWLDQAVAVAWLHDCMEDQGVACETLRRKFGETISNGVRLLSDLETGNRAERKAASRARLAAAPGWVQTIKCADLISNTSSIVQHDPKFAVTYLEEKRLLLDVMTKADLRLVEIARNQSDGGRDAVFPEEPMHRQTLERAAEICDREADDALRHRMYEQAAGSIGCAEAIRAEVASARGA